MTQREAWREHAPELLGEIADAAAGALVEVSGMDAKQAAYLGYHIMRAIAERCGGAQVYIPKADAIERCERDEAIWQAFTGTNTRELARRFGVTEIHIYRIIKRMRARARLQAARPRSIYNAELRREPRSGESP